MTISLEKGFILTLLGLSVLLHLPFLDHPAEVIFDEVHFGKFVNGYCCTHENFFDIHPPHAKLLIAGMARFAGYDGHFSFKNIGDPYDAAVPVVGLRLVPALAGTVLPVVIYLLLRQLGVSQLFSFAGGWMLLFDNALTVHSRLISLDSLLLLSIFGSLLAYLYGRRLVLARDRIDEQPVKVMKPLSVKRWFLLAGALAGFAAGVKFTGLVAIGLLGLLALFDLWRGATVEHMKQWIGRGLLVLVTAFVVYLAGWAFHFSLLTLPGSGDAFREPNWEGPLPLAFVRETVELHRVMFSANYNLDAEHSFASRWWSWPLMHEPVYYWEGGQPKIYFYGNPLVWWSSLAVFLLAVGWTVYRSGKWFYQVVIRKRNWKIETSKQKLEIRKQKIENGNWVLLFLLVGYLVSFLPLVRVPRPLFLYHYLTPLIFSLLLGLVWLQSVGFDRWLLARKWRSLILLWSFVVVFLFISPVTYALVVPTDWQEAILLLPKGFDMAIEYIRSM